MIFTALGLKQMRATTEAPPETKPAEPPQRTAPVVPDDPAPAPRSPQPGRKEVPDCNPQPGGPGIETCELADAEFAFAE